MAKGLDVVINGVETVSEKMDDIESSVRSANQALGSLSRELKDASVSSEFLESSSDSLARSATKVNASTRQAASAVDELGDDSREAAAEVGVLGTVMDKTAISAGALSINVGAFTVALRQLHTQIPLIVTTLGSLISVLGGVSAAAIAAGGGISAIFAGGAIGLMERVEDQFSDVNSSAEALQKIMRGVANMFREALDPIVNVENTDLFISFLEDIAVFANRSAQAIDASRDSILQFFDVIAKGGDFNAFAGSLQNVLEFEPGGEFDSAGEVLARFIGYLVEKLPDAINFFNRVTVSMAAPLQQVMKEFKLLTIELVEFAEGAAPGFLSAISEILELFTSLFDALNDLSGELISNTVKAIAFTAILFRLAKAFDAVALITIKFGRLLNTTIAEAKTFADLTARIATAGQGFLDQYAKGVLELSRALVAQIPVLKNFQGAIDDFYVGKNKKELKNFDKRLKIVKGSVEDLATSIKKNLTSFALDEDIVEAPKMGGFRSADTGRTVSLDLTTDKFKQALGTARKRLIGVGKQGIAAGKKIASGLGNVAIGGLEVLTSSIVGILHPGLIKSKALTDIFNDGLSRMAEGLNKVGLGIIPRTVKALAVKAAALYANATAFFALEKRAIQYAFTQKGVMAGMKAIAVSAYSAVVGMLSFAASLVTSALGALTLSAALGPITIAILAITAAGALLVGVLGNMDGIISSVKSSFSGLKDFIFSLADAMLGYLVPAFNLIVSMLGIILGPVFAIVDGFKLIISTIGEALSQGEDGTGIMESFAGVMDFLGRILDKIAPIFDVIGNVLYASFILPFKAAAIVIGGIINIIIDLIAVIRKLAKESGLVNMVKQLVSGVKEIVGGFVDMVTKQVNRLIKITNKILGTNISELGEGGGGGFSDRIAGVKTTQEDVVGNAGDLMSKDSEDAGSDQAQTTTPEFNLETSVSNTANVDAESSEKEERIATLVERALNDANTYRRSANGR